MRSRRFTSDRELAPTPAVPERVAPPEPGKVGRSTRERTQNGAGNGAVSGWEVRVCLQGSPRLRGGNAVIKQDFCPALKSRHLRSIKAVRIRRFREQIQVVCRFRSSEYSVL